MVVWRGLAEVCHNHLHKGSRVYVDGRLKTRSWQDEIGQTRERTEDQAHYVICLDRRGQALAEASLPEKDLLDTTA